MPVPEGYPDDLPEGYPEHLAEPEWFVTGPVLPPSSFYPGLLPPKYPAGTVCGFLSEHPEVVDIIPEADWDAELAKLTDDSALDRWVHVKSQGRDPSCAWETTAQEEELVEQFQGNEFVELNPLFGFYHTGSSGGSSHDENLAFLRAYGCAPESVWPRSMGWRQKPSEEAYEAAKAHRGREFYQVRTWEEVGSCLIARKPVILGWPGHSILPIELKRDKRTLRGPNSWDTDWNGDGYFEMDKTHIVYGYGIYVVLNSIRHPA